MRRFQASVFLFAIVLVVPTAESAVDPLAWPQFRGNRDRNGRIEGTGNIVKPAVQARLKLGGNATFYQMAFENFLWDSKPELLIVEAGRLYLKSSNGKVIWHTDNLGISEIIGVYDLNKDGAEEAVTISPGPDVAISIFSMQTGKKIWHYDQFGENAGSMGAHQAVVTDLDGDSFDDLLCFAKDNAPDIHAFSFANGYSQQASSNVLWRYSRTVYRRDTPVVIGNVDGDDALEVVFLEKNALTILAAESGAQQTHQPELFSSFSLGPISLANIDSDTELEIIAIGAMWRNLAITVYDASPGIDQVIWQYQWYPTDGKQLVAYDNSVIDIDGDGELEIVVGIYNNTDDEITTFGSAAGQHDGVQQPNRWVVAVYNAANGSVEQVIANSYLRGISQLLPGEKPFLFLQSTSQGELIVPSYTDLTITQLNGDPDSINSAKLLYQVSEPDPLRTRGTSVHAVQFDSSQPNGAPLVFFTEIDANLDGAGEQVIAYTIENGQLNNISNLKLDEWANYTPISTIKSDGSISSLVWRHNKGELHQLNKQLAVTTKIPIGEFSPIVVSDNLNTTASKELLTTKSTGTLESFELRPNGLTSSWNLQTGTNFPIATIDIDDDGDIEIVVADSKSAQTPAVRLLSGSGQSLWQHDFTNFGSYVTDLSFGHFDGDLILDVVVLVKDLRQPADEDIRLVSLSGADGSEIWNAYATQSIFVGGTLHVADVSGDSLDDVTIVEVTKISSYDGTDGSLLASTSYHNWSVTNFSADIDGDDDNELVLINWLAEEGIVLYELDSLTPVWNIPHNYDAELAYYWPAVFHRADGLGIIKTSPTGSIQAYDADGSSLWGPAWIQKGELVRIDPNNSNATEYVSTADIDGDNQEDAIIGTEDGYVVAIDVIDGTLTWSIPLYAPVNEPILSDVDGDGELEVVASTNDGYMHVIDQEKLKSPKNVKDVPVDQLAGINLAEATDIDTTPVRNALGASWDKVDGADGYYVSAMDSAGILLTPWVDVGDVDTAIIPTAPLPLDALYQIVVQAYNTLGERSADSLSDGVVISDHESPNAELQVEPRVFNPYRQRAMVQYNFTDSTWLEHFDLQFFDHAGLPVSQVDGALYGTDWVASLAWPESDETTTPPPDGTYEIEITVQDASSNQALSTTSVILDSIAPPPPVIATPLSGSVIGDGQPVFSGTAEPLSSIVLSINSSDLCSTVTDDSGSWSCQSSEELLEANYQATSVSIDEAGNQSEPSQIVPFSVGDELESVQASGSGCSCQTPGTRPTAHFSPTLFWVWTLLF